MEVLDIDKPLIDRVSGCWDLITVIGEDGTRSSERLHRWDLYKSGSATFNMVTATGLVMDNRSRTWKVSEKADSDGNYTFYIDDEPRHKIIFLNQKEMIMRSLPSKGIVQSTYTSHYKKLY